MNEQQEETRLSCDGTDGGRVQCECLKYLGGQVIGEKRQENQKIRDKCGKVSDGSNKSILGSVPVLPSCGPPPFHLKTRCPSELTPFSLSHTPVSGFVALSKYFQESL